MSYLQWQRGVQLLYCMPNMSCQIPALKSFYGFAVFGSMSVRISHNGCKHGFLLATYVVTLSSCICSKYWISKNINLPAWFLVGVVIRTVEQM